MIYFTNIDLKLDLTSNDTTFSFLYIVLPQKKILQNKWNIKQAMNIKNVMFYIL